jgi:hypothetical protein
LNCPVCGASFDPTRYQVVVEALGAMPFDRIECAEIALAERRSRQADLRRRWWRRVRLKTVCAADERFPAERS